MKTLVPHALPYVAYVGIGALPAWFGHWTDAVRVAVVGLLLLWFWSTGAYGELRPAPSWRQAAVGIAVGAAVGAAWVPLARLGGPLPFSDGARENLDPTLAEGQELASKIVGMVLLIPFAEELFVRSALPRFIDAKHGEDWRARPVGAFTVGSAAVSVAFFTLAHPEWLPALATGVAWTALLAQTRSLRVLVISHAVANAWLAVYIVKTGESQWW